MSIENGVRALEEGIKTDFSRSTDYAGYLDLDTLLSAQHPISDHHDEPLFIIQHQTSELWLKLVLHELAGVRENLDADDVSRARKGLSRVKHIFRTLTDQWSVLATLTPSEYAEFRGVLGNSSGFQSYQYRAVEFILGNKNEALLAVFRSRPEAQAMLAETLRAPDRLRRVPALPRPPWPPGAAAGSGAGRQPGVGRDARARRGLQDDLRGHHDLLGGVRHLRGPR